MNIRQLLDQRVSLAFTAAQLPENTPTVIKPSARLAFGHYQINGVMGAAKKLRTNPRALANEIIAQLDLGDMAAKVEIAGPGFINIHLKPEWLATQLALAQQSSHLGIDQTQYAMTVVVDYSGPNLA
jgi:arginyl-tRNA synthetase